MKFLKFKFYFFEIYFNNCNVDKNPDKKKKVSTPKTAPAINDKSFLSWTISYHSVKLLEGVYALNAKTWPKTIQQIDNTLTPFNTSKF